MKFKRHILYLDIFYTFGSIISHFTPCDIAMVQNPNTLYFARIKIQCHICKTLVHQRSFALFAFNDLWYRYAIMKYLQKYHKWNICCNLRPGLVISSFYAVNTATISWNMSPWPTINYKCRSYFDLQCTSDKYLSNSAQIGWIHFKHQTS